MTDSQTPEADHEGVDAEALPSEWVDATGVGFETHSAVQGDPAEWGGDWGDVDLSEVSTPQETVILADAVVPGEGVHPENIEPATLMSVEGQRELRERLTRFLMPYKFAIDEVMTKIKILQEEFTHTGEYNPIEHVSARLKDIDSIVEKMEVRGIAGDFDQVRETITDIAGVRVVCSFISDVYRVFELLTAQRDVRVHTVKDYIANPKPNGYRSLHLILELPVYLSNGEVNTLVEVQIRTIAMDFWASLEHKIYYKYDREVPEGLLQGLKDAAAQAGQLDASMEWLHIAIRGGERSTLVRRSADAMLASERETETEDGEDPGTA